MKTIYAIYDKLDNSISGHFIGGENVSDKATLRAVRAQFKDHFAVKDLQLIAVGCIDDEGTISEMDKSWYVIGELFSDEDKIENA